jgi:hypothetical protein
MKKKNLFGATIFGAIAELILIVSSVMIGASMVKEGAYWPMWFVLVAVIVAVLTRLASESFKTGEEI